MSSKGRVTQKRHNSKGKKSNLAGKPCHKTFIKFQNSKRHEDWTRSNDTKFHCFCGRAYKNRGWLDRHTRMHETEDGANLEKKRAGQRGGESERRIALEGSLESVEGLEKWLQSQKKELEATENKLRSLQRWLKSCIKELGGAEQ